MADKAGYYRKEDSSLFRETEIVRDHGKGCD